MADITQILQAADGFDPKTAERILPLVYDELRRLAAAKMASQPPGQTLLAISSTTLGPDHPSTVEARLDARGP